jgi:hypothetical protein
VAKNDYIYYVNNKQLLMNLILNNSKSLLIAAISFYIAYLTGTGIILDYISFADPLNEMALFVLATMMGTGALFTLTLKK